MSGLILESWGLFRDREIPPPTPIVDPIICKGSLGMIYGPRGIGKSLLCQNLAYSVASGQAFLGYAVSESFVVVYADGEMTDFERQQRFQKAELLKPSNAARANLHIIRPDFDEGRLPDIETESGQSEFESRLPPKTALLIIDNLSAWCRSGREDAEAWRRVQEWALRLRARGLAVIFVHHANKRGAQRGTSMREDALDYVISLRLPAGTPGASTQFELHFDKLRHLPKSKAKPRLIRYRTPKGKPPYWSVKSLSPPDQLQRILALQKQGIKNTQIAKQLGLSRATVQRYLQDGRAQGVVD